MKYNKKFKICRIATVPIALYGSKHQLVELSREGIDLTIVCTPTDLFMELEDNKHYKLFGISISREISFFSDLTTLVKLFLFFKKNKFEIVHSHTPKAGILVAISAFLARVPCRVHTYTGQRWVTLKGPKRKILILCDTIISKLNTFCFADSPSQVDFLIEKKIVNPKKTSCLKDGSIAGIDLNRFSFEKFTPRNEKTRKDLNISSQDIVITFLGRVVKDKGIGELVKAFLKINKKHTNIKLLLLGPIEKNHELSNEIITTIKQEKNIIHLGFVTEPEKYLAISHIFCLPSYREGFPSVILEANALKVPAIGTNIVGLKDTIINNQTGYLVEQFDTDDLTEKLNILISNNDLREEMGEFAYQRVIKSFSSKVITKELARKYKSFINWNL